MPKPYKVSRIQGAPNYDSLPVAKITDYPLEERDYKPFAQAVLCVSEQALHLRMWAFEVSPAENSMLACALYPFPNQPEQGLFLRIWHEGDRSICGVELLRGGKIAFSRAPDQLMLHTLETHPHNGEDLQGVYWGRTMSLPIGCIEEMGGPVSLAAGVVLPGNFYKVCEAGQSPHWGSYFRAKFPDEPVGRESMGEFQIVNY